MTRIVTTHYRYKRMTSVYAGMLCVLLLTLLLAGCADGGQHVDQFTCGQL